MSPPQSGAPLGASYRLVERIGAGAAGDVWRAESSTDGTTFAAKILKAEHTKDPALVERFIRERSVLVALQHPSIVAVRDLVIEGTTLAIVMDFVAGGSLRDLLDQGGPLAADQALSLCAQVFDALAEAHAQQVTHRDIKPDNVLLTERWQAGHRGTVRVTDFGIASVVNDRRRETTGLLGTPHYMAPELISHGQTTPAADVYSTGVLLYELLAGRTPFAGGGTDFTIAYRHVTSRPPRLDVPEALWTVVDRLLAKDPRQRPGAAEAAGILREVTQKVRGLAPLDRAQTTDQFEEIERPATMLRSDLLSTPKAVPAYVSPLGADAPELGEAGQHTMLRSMRVHRPPAPTSDPAAASSTVKRRPAWLTKKTVLLAAAGVVCLAGLGVGATWMMSGTTTETAASATDALEASQRDPALPTGLSVSRIARFDPHNKTVSLEITYGAQKAPLSGDFLEVVPGTTPDGTCPPVSWDGARATKHQVSTTGLKADCGWRLEGIEIPANGQAVVTASFPLTMADVSELEDWLTTVAAATTGALTSADASSVSYAVQRLQDIQIVTPSRTVSQTTLPVTLVPVWPGGPDPLNPLYQSPAIGARSQMLQNIAGAEGGVRFSDGCSGAVAVSSDGLVVTTLSVTTECVLYATVGNFTDIQSAPFGITTRE